MAGQHVGVVHLVDMVAGEDDHILRVVHINEAQVLVNGVGGALVPGAALGALVGRQDVDAAGGAVQVPGLAAADIAVQLQGAVLGQHAHGVDTGVGAVGKREVDDAVLTAEGDGGLCHVSGKDIEAAALSSGQQHGNAFFFHVSFSSFACFFALGFFAGFSAGSSLGAFSALAEDLTVFTRALAEAFTVFPAALETFSTAFTALGALGSLTALGFGKVPSPRRNTAPKAGMRMAAECSLPWDSMASTGTGSQSPKPSPPYSTASVLKTGAYCLWAGTPMRYPS